MRLENMKKSISFILSFIMLFGTIFVADTVVNVKVSAASEPTYAKTSVWSGKAASYFADGSGTETDPYIIATADQLYKMVSGDGKQTNGDAAYYKVADGVTTFYLNNVDTLDEIKTLVNSGDYKNWTATGTFHGNFDGNGVTVYGMVSYNADGFIYAFNEGASIKNINFDSCFAYGGGNVAIVTTRVGSYTDIPEDNPVIANVSVRNVYVRTTRNISVSSSGWHNASAGGLVSTGDTPKKLTMSNCFFDGYSSELVQGSGSTADATAGIFAGSSGSNNVTLSACVSLGAQIFPQASGANYTRYDENNSSGFQFFAYNCYCDLEETVKETAVVKIDKRADYEIKDMPGLNWSANWQLVEVTDGMDEFTGYPSRLIPMPKANSIDDGLHSTYASKIAAQINGGGAYNVMGGSYIKGTYGMYYELDGSGTKDDPYLINSAFELARAIASGGMNVYNRVYYKLACDIDASDMSWITQDSIASRYIYVPFNGELDGDGHTVSGIYVGDDQSVGLIPILDSEGVVKNLHIRNGCFVSGNEYAGAIAGEVILGAKITGCSAENCLVASNNTDSHIVGNEKNTTITNSYFVSDFDSTSSVKTAYYDADGNTGDIDVEQNKDVWYIGGTDSSTPKLKNFAAAREFADIDGDGNAQEYAAADLVALRRSLLSAQGYENIYGDINRDGEVNISDLAVLSRSIVEDYDKLYDGFWRNANLGKIRIFYGENDNYDAARRLEIYLEQELNGIDVQKVVSADKTVSGTSSDKNAVYVHSNDTVGKPTGSLEIIIGNISNYSDYAKNTLDTNDYSISFDKENCVLWLNGGSFTGVEQAVLDFISNSDFKTDKVYTVDVATLSTEKQAKTVKIDTDYDGVADSERTFYYAWGDEFDGVIDADEGENAQISFDTWNHTTMNTESVRGTAGTYRNVEGVNREEMSKLYWVEDGKLSITRGVKAEYATAETDKIGYVRLENQSGTDAFGGEIDDEDIIANPGLIKANHSMLYKQGYAEMYGSLPSDGHTFASWWMLGHGALNNTGYTESLYSKIYKLNDSGNYAYDGTTSTLVSTDPTTFKYQVPTNYFEIDVWELMQHPERVNNAFSLGTSLVKSRTTGAYDYGLYLNVHKFYSVGANKASTVNVIDWDNPATPRAVMQKEWFGASEDDYYFSTTAALYGFTDGTNTRYTQESDWRNSSKKVTTAYYVEELQRRFTAYRRYGFYWSTNGVDKFNFTLYIYDVNGDGVEDDNAILGSSDLTYNKQDGYDPQNYDIVNDAETANQYMYFLFDNVLYTSNPNHSNATDEEAVMHTDMLTNEGTDENPDKVSLEIDYIRVYQADGRRDIVTRETEDFNNGNHFGY